MSGGAGWSLETWRASRVRAFQEAEALLAQAARPRRCSRDPLLPPLLHTGSSPTCLLTLLARGDALWAVTQRSCVMPAHLEGVMGE